MDKALANAAVIRIEMEIGGSGTVSAALVQRMCMTGLAPFVSGGFFADLAGRIINAGALKDS